MDFKRVGTTNNSQITVFWFLEESIYESIITNLYNILGPGPTLSTHPQVRHRDQVLNPEGN
jgi:hypothetical protein